MVGLQHKVLKGATEMKTILKQIIHLFEYFEKIDDMTQIKYLRQLKKIPGLRIMIRNEEI